MLYTRFVIGEETLSSTIAFSFPHPAIFSTAIKSFILGPFAPCCWALTDATSCGHYLLDGGNIKREIGASLDVVEAMSSTARYLRGGGPRTAITTNRSGPGLRIEWTMPDGAKAASPADRRSV
jgi:hypothetical protein